MGEEKSLVNMLDACSTDSATPSSCTSWNAQQPVQTTCSTKKMCDEAGEKIDESGLQNTTAVHSSPEALIDISNSTKKMRDEAGEQGNESGLQNTTAAHSSPKAPIEEEVYVRKIIMRDEEFELYCFPTNIQNQTEHIVVWNNKQAPMHNQELVVRKTTKDDFGRWNADILRVGHGGFQQLVSVVATDTNELLFFGTSRQPFRYLKSSWVPSLRNKKLDDLKKYSPYELVFEGRKLDACGKFVKRGRNWDFYREEPDFPNVNCRKYYEARNYVEILTIDDDLCRTSFDLLNNGEWKNGENLKLMYRLLTQHCVAVCLAVDHALNCWRERASVTIQVSRTENQKVKFQFVLFDKQPPQWAQCVKQPFKAGDTVIVASESHTFLAKLLFMDVDTKKGELEFVGLNAMERGGKLFENCSKLKMDFFKSANFTGWFPHDFDAIEPMFRLLCDSRKSISTNKTKRENVHLDSTIRPPTMNLKGGQLSAFQAICGESKFVLINAPPGTGKSTLVGEALSVLRERKQQVLLLSNLNVAVDGLAQKSPDLESTRVASIERSQGCAFLKSIQNGLYYPSSKEENAVSEYRKAWRSVINEKYSEESASKLKNAEAKVLAIYYDKPVPIKLMTVALFIKKRIPKKSEVQTNKYDVVIVDEASLLSTSDLLSILWRIGSDARLVLIGDTKQLMPKNASGSYNFSDFRNLTNIVEPINLDCSFRSLPAIVNSWKFMYNNVEVKCFHRDKDSSLHKRFELPSSSLLMKLDTANNEENGINKNEIEHMSNFASKVVNSGLVDDSEIMVLCYYRAQANRIKKLMGNRKFRVHTVDEAQGSESRVVIIATTTCTATPHVQDPARATVALSRAKELQICFVDRKVVEQSPLWKDISRNTTNYSYALDC